MDIYSVVSAVFLVLYLVIGVYAGKNTKTLEDHYVMSRSASAFLIMGTLIASNISSVTFTGWAGLAASVGPLSVICQFGAGVTGSLVLGLWCGKYFYRMKLLTMPDFFTKRYTGSAPCTLASLIVVVSSVAYLITVILGSVVVTKSLFNWGTDMSLLLILGIITIFTVVGGMRSVVVTDTVMFFVFLIGAMIVGPAIIMKLGGMQKAVELAAEKAPQVFNWYGNEQGIRGVMRLIEVNMLSFFIVLAAPHLISRVNIASSEREFGKAVVYLSIALPLLLLSLLYPFGYFTLLDTGVEAVQAFPWVAKNLVPPFLGAIAMAGVVAAAISTATSFLQQASATLSANIIKGIFVPSMSKKTEFFISRCCVVLIVAIVYISARVPQIGETTIIYNMMFATGCFAAWLPALYLGVLWKKATTAGAIWSMAITLPFVLALFMMKGNGALPEWFPINLTGIICSMSLMYFVSLKTRTTELENKVFEEMHADAR